MRTVKWMRRLSGVYAVYSLIILSALSTIFVVLESDFFLKKVPSVFDRRIEYEQFTTDWCRVRRFERDWEMIVAPCKGQLAWEQRQPGSPLRTDPNTSFISSWDLKPVGKCLKTREIVQFPKIIDSVWFYLTTATNRHINCKEPT